MPEWDQSTEVRKEMFTGKDQRGRSTIIEDQDSTRVMKKRKGTNDLAIPG